MSLFRNSLISCCFCLFCGTPVAFAETTGPQIIEQLICEYNNNCYIRIAVPANASPKCADNRFVIEASSRSGKNILALLSMAFLAKKPVNVTFYYCNGNDYSLSYVSLLN